MRRCNAPPFAERAPWQRCRVHWLRNAPAHVGKAQPSMASAALRRAFLQHRCMGVEAMGGMLKPPPTNEAPQRPPKAA